jgi:hypothetical protein
MRRPLIDYHRDRQGHPGSTQHLRLFFSQIVTVHVEKEGEGNLRRKDGRYVMKKFCPGYGVYKRF